MNELNKLEGNLFAIQHKICESKEKSILEQIKYVNENDWKLEVMFSLWNGKAQEIEFNAKRTAQIGEAAMEGIESSEREQPIMTTSDMTSSMSIDVSD